MMTFLLFAGMRETAGVSAVTLPPPEPGATVAQAWQGVCAAHPALEPWTGVTVFARNGAYAEPDTPVEDGDELAAIPPVSGG